MAEFDFGKVEVKKSAKVPALTRTRQSRPNPLAARYEQSDKNRNADGYGEWLSMDLPGKVETVTDNAGKEKVTYGNVVKQAMNYLRQAAANKNRGVSFRVEEPDGENKLKDGTLRLHFQAKPKRGADNH